MERYKRVRTNCPACGGTGIADAGGDCVFCHGEGYLYHREYERAILPAPPETRDFVRPMGVRE